MKNEVNKETVIFTINHYIGNNVFNFTCKGCKSEYAMHYNAKDILRFCPYCGKPILQIENRCKDFTNSPMGEYGEIIKVKHEERNCTACGKVIFGL